MSTLQRQLNLYGFRCPDRLDQRGVYHHPNFVRGEYDTVRAIRRKKTWPTKKKPRGGPDPEPKPAATKQQKSARKCNNSGVEVPPIGPLPTSTNATANPRKRARANSGDASASSNKLALITPRGIDELRELSPLMECNMTTMANWRCQSPLYGRPSTNNNDADFDLELDGDLWDEEGNDNDNNSLLGSDGGFDTIDNQVGTDQNLEDVFRLDNEVSEYLHTLQSSKFLSKAPPVFTSVAAAPSHSIVSIASVGPAAACGASEPLGFLGNESPSKEFDERVYHLFESDD